MPKERTTFSQSISTELEGKKAITPFLNKIATNLIWTGKDEFLQNNYGDALLTTDMIDLLAVELKSEWDNPNGNLYLEEWSNRKWGTVGWMFKLHCCDILLYQFMNTKELYGVDFQKLATWFKVNYKKFKSRQQGKCIQANDTWGRLVPISVLIEEVKMVPIPFYTHGDGVESWELLLKNLKQKKTKKPTFTFKNIQRYSETNITQAELECGGKIIGRD